MLPDLRAGLSPEEICVTPGYPRLLNMNLTSLPEDKASSNGKYLTSGNCIKFYFSNQMGEESKNKSRMAGGYVLVVTASRTLPRHLRKEKVKKKLFTHR